MKKINDFKYKKTNNDSLNLVGKIKLKLLLTLAFFTITSVFGQLVFASNLAVDGQKLSEIEKQIQQLEAENTTLKVEIAKESSLLKLSEKAQEMGFRRPSEVIIPN